MFNYLINTTQRWDEVLYRKPTMQAIIIAIKQSVPILAIDIYWRLIMKIAISPDALLANLFDQYPILPDNVIDISRHISSLLDATVILIFIAGLTHQYLKEKSIQNTTLPVLTNLIITYLLLFNKNQLIPYNTVPYLLITVITILTCQTYLWYYNRNSPALSHYALRYLFWSFICIIIFGKLLHIILQLPRLQSFSSTILSQSFFTTFLGLLLVSFFSPILFIMGLPLPLEFTNNQTTLNTVVANLDTMLTHGLTTLPFPENLYSVYGSFTLLGGIGNTLALNVLLLFAASKSIRRLGLLAWIPSLFDNNCLLFSGMPLFMRPLMLVPMLMTNIISMLISYTAIACHFIHPSVYITPSNLPNILLPTLASPTPIRSTLVTILIFCVSLLIYRPFLSRLILEVSHEK